MAQFKVRLCHVNIGLIDVTCIKNFLRDDLFSFFAIFILQKTATKNPHRSYVSIHVYSIVLYITGSEFQKKIIKL